MLLGFIVVVFTICYLKKFNKSYKNVSQSCSVWNNGVKNRERDSWGDFHSVALLLMLEINI